MKRQISFDTETTGLKPEDGHKIVEIGCVEIIDGVKTGKTYHMYLNPDRESDPKALEIHGLTTEFLKDKPRFADIADGFLKFVEGADLLIHNADFDIKFINKALDMANKGKIWNYIKNVECTMKKDKMLHADERKHTLDAMCLRYGIDNSNRTLHGALLDADLLADCVIERNSRFSPDEIEADLEQSNWQRPPIKRYNVPLVSVKTSEEEEQNHENYLNSLEKTNKTPPVFRSIGKSENTLKM